MLQYFISFPPTDTLTLHCNAYASANLKQQQWNIFLLLLSGKVYAPASCHRHIAHLDMLLLLRCFFCCCCYLCAMCMPPFHPDSHQLLLLLWLAGHNAAIVMVVRCNFLSRISFPKPTTGIDASHHIEYEYNWWRIRSHGLHSIRPYNWFWTHNSFRKTWLNKRI